MRTNFWPTQRVRRGLGHIPCRIPQAQYDVGLAHCLGCVRVFVDLHDRWVGLFLTPFLLSSRFLTPAWTARLISNAGSLEALLLRPDWQPAARLPNSSTESSRSSVHGEQPFICLLWPPLSCKLLIQSKSINAVVWNATHPLLPQV